MLFLAVVFLAVFLAAGFFVVFLAAFLLAAAAGFLAAGFLGAAFLLAAFVAGSSFSADLAAVFLDFFAGSSFLARLGNRSLASGAISNMTARTRLENGAAENSTASWWNREPKSRPFDLAIARSSPGAFRLAKSLSLIAPTMNSDCMAPLLSGIACPPRPFCVK